MSCLPCPAESHLLEYRASTAAPTQPILWKSCSHLWLRLIHPCDELRCCCLQDMEEGEEAKEAAAATWASLKRSTKCGPRRTVRKPERQEDAGSSTAQQDAQHSTLKRHAAGCCCSLASASCMHSIVAYARLQR
eukprot:GHRQ01028724.1.p1 GENE.GHRQ01028724.1~~GHRQ01028724.1.p1  ORF type:complete len:134 (-),score=36.89 GHRQ01028724.1:372-773(-)